MAKIAASLFMSMIVGMAILALMGSQVNAITCADGIKALLPCEAYLVGKGPDQPTPQCCISVQKLYSSTSTADRRLLCQCFKNASGSYGVDHDRARNLPSRCHLSIPIVISPTVDCSKIQLA